MQRLSMGVVGTFSDDFPLEKESSDFYGDGVAELARIVDARHSFDESLVLSITLDGRG
jgi:hypothetical protein